MSVHPFPTDDLGTPRLSVRTLELAALDDVLESKVPGLGERLLANRALVEEIHARRARHVARLTREDGN